jgi:hypothetical protein
VKEKATVLFGKLRKKRNPPVAARLPLQALTPTPKAQGVDGALCALEDVFADSQKPLYNIALTGGYGTGKSSVLETFKSNILTEVDGDLVSAPRVKPLEFLTLSFTHFGPPLVDPTKKPPPDDDKKLPPKSDKKPPHVTERWEMEAKLLNQLVHQMPAHKIRHTRFPIKNMLKDWQWLPVIAASLLLSVALLCGVIAAGWFPVPETNPDRILFIVVAAVLTLGAIALLSWFFSSVWRGGLRLTRLSLKDQAIEFSRNPDKDKSDELPLLDKYLTEVLYVLERAKNVDAIVIEDIDRTDDNQLFVQLREICRLANIQRKKNQKPLRFIYLLKDEMFKATDRTKFFDLIIPVTPVFVSATRRLVELSRLVQNAGLFDAALFDDEGVIKEPAEGEAPSWPYYLLTETIYTIRDFRLMKNIVNEAQVLGDFKPQDQGETQADKDDAKEKAPSIDEGEQSQDVASKPPTVVDLPGDTVAPLAQGSTRTEEEETAVPIQETSKAPTGAPDPACKRLAMVIYKNLFPLDYEHLLHSHGMVHDFFEHNLKPSIVSIDTLKKREIALLCWFLEHKLIDKDVIKVATKQEATKFDEAQGERESTEYEEEEYARAVRQIRAMKRETLRDEAQRVVLGGRKYRVLAVDGNSALLLQNQVEEHREYHSELKPVTWESCSLRTYLNTSYLFSLPHIVQFSVLVTYQINLPNTYGIRHHEAFYTPGGGDTQDSIFLLSLEELFKYLGVDEILLAQKEKDKEGDFWRIRDQYARKRIAWGISGGAVWWRLRSPGYDPRYAAYVGGDGSVSLGGRNVIDTSGGVRPAFWISLDA